MNSLRYFPIRYFIAGTLLTFPVACAQSAPATDNSFKAAPAAKPSKNVQYAVKDEAEFFGLLDLSRPDMADVKSAVANKDWAAAKIAWAKHLQTRAAPQWIWSYRDRASITKVLAEQFDGLSASVPIADKTLARQFGAQGKVETLEKSPDWLKNGGEWTHVLNRFAFLRPMGEAYWQTGDDKYADDAAFLLRDWIARNPIPEELGKTTYAQGTAWRSLETGIRLQSWLEAQQFFMNAPAFDDETQYQITRSMIEHARRIYQLESVYRAGNWQVNEVAGLSSVGIMLPEFKESAEWRKRGFQYMVEHMQKDVLADGAEHELTPIYHSWVMNQFLQVALLAKKNGYEIPGLLDRHEKMYEFLEKISRPDGNVPPLGDAHPQPIANDMGIGALLYNRADYRHFGPDKAQADWIWDFGPGVVNRYAQLSSKLPDYTSALLPDAQLGIMRSGWNKDDDYLLFDMAPWGGNHSHADRLQVLVYAGGRDLLLDAGQYAYDLPLSQYFKTAVEHNVLLLDGETQIQADPKVLAWQEQNAAIFASGSIEDKAFRHQRSVLWIKSGYYVIADWVTPLAAATPGPHTVTRLFHLPVGEAKSNGNSVQTTFGEGMNVQLQDVGAGTLQMREDWLTDGGATARKAPVAAYVSHGELPMTFITVVTPFSDAKNLPKVEALPVMDSVTRLRLSFADGQSDEIALAASPTILKIGTHQTSGHALVVRRGAQGESVTAVP